MKKIVASVLSVMLILSTISVIFTSAAVAVTPTELFTNGKFVNNTGVIPDGWTFSGSGVANLTAGVNTTDKSPDGSNSFKFTQTDKISTMAFFYNTNAITLKTNADYVVTMWVKSQNIKSMRFYLFEPNYTDRSGAAKTSETPVEGQNMYSYSYDNGSTHVCRTNITHTYKLNNAVLSSGPSSMAIVRDATGATQLDVSSDFPAQTGVNQWTKLTYTFTTSTAAADVGTVRFGVGLKDLAGNAGTASIADLSFTETPKPFAFTPAVNDGELGGVFPKTQTINGSGNLSFVACPTDGNTFTNWTLNGVSYSTSPAITGTFSQSDVLQANFGTGNIVTNAGAEKLTLNANVAPYDSANAKWTGDWFVLDYSSDRPGPSWATITVSNSFAHSGKQSYKLGTRYQYGGRKITGLQMNKDYYLSFWYYLPALTSSGKQKFNWASVVPGSVSTNRTTITAGGTALGSINLNKSGTGAWTCVTIPFNSMDNTSVQLITSFGTDDAADAMYVDDIGLFSGAAVQVAAATSDGGTISTSRTGTVPKGSAVSFLATSTSDGSFKGWYDAADQTKLITTSLNYVTTANSDINIIALFDVVHVGIASVGIGGTATVSKSGTVAKNSSVTFTATPNQGNTFKGWYDSTDNHLVSTSATYTTNVTFDLYLTAAFDGYNKPPIEKLKNGSFETATIPGWFADDPNYGSSVGWCTWVQSTKCAYEGTHSLKINSKYRNSILPLTNLSQNTDYRVSFYVHMYSKAWLANAFIGAPGTTDIGGADIVKSITGPLYGGLGWQRIEMYFNTGNLTSVNLGIRYSAENTYPYTNTYDTVDAMYLDNLELYEYSAAPSIVNGNFDAGLTGLWGNYTITANKEAQLAGEDAYMSQTVAVKPFTDYRVNFKAKASTTSAVKAAVVDFAKNTITNKGMITSYSYTDANGTDWANYTLVFNSGNQQAVKLLFENNGTGISLVDSVSLVEEADAAGGKIEAIDFESDRFAITDYYLSAPTVSELPLAHATYLQSDLAQIYTKQSPSDTNVHSGNASLRIKYDSSTNSLEKVLQQVWSAFPIQQGDSYRFTAWYKSATTTNSLTLSPDLSGDYIYNSEQLITSNDWTKIQFDITNVNGYNYLQMVLGNDPSVTRSDIYLDDITFQLAPPRVTEENTDESYCELLYDEVENQSFELPTTDADWGATLPGNFQIATGGAASENNYLHVTKSDTKYILAVPTKPGVLYNFGASVRGTAGTDAYIGLTTDSAGTKFMVNDQEQAASKISVTAGDGNWHRGGFQFLSSLSGYTYLVIKAKGGSIDIDNVMLFVEYFGYNYDPNDYTVYVPYNFDDMTHVYINGGEGPQPYIDGTGTILSGDINNDGTVDLRDVTQLSRYIAGWQLGIDPIPPYWDVNKDGKIDLMDITLLSRYVAGWSVTLPDWNTY